MTGTKTTTLDICVFQRWTATSIMAACVLSSALLCDITAGMPASTPSLEMDNNNEVEEGSSSTTLTAYDKNCRIHLLPQIRGCTMGFLQHYHIHQKQNHKKQKQRTGNLCHSYGETLQCLHLAFLQCPPTDVHLDLMEAQLPHPDLMQKLCFGPPRNSQSMEDDNTMEENMSSDVFPITTQSTEANTYQSQTTTTRLTVNKGGRLKIVVSQTLYKDDTSVDTKEMSPKSEGFGQSTPRSSDSVLCKDRTKCEPDLAGDSTVLVVEKSDKKPSEHLLPPHTKLSYISSKKEKEERVSGIQSNNIKHQARLTQTTDRECIEHLCDTQTGQCQSNTGNKLLPSACTIHFYYVGLILLLLLYV